MAHPLRLSNLVKTPFSSLEVLKILTVLSPAVFIGVFELVRHRTFLESQPMLLGNLLVVLAMVAGSFFLSRFVFGKLERMQKKSLQQNKELAVCEERERIAREMHDGMAQVISYINVKIQTARQLMDSYRHDQARSELIELEHVAQQQYVDIREAILALKSTIPLQEDLTSILQRYVCHFSQISDVKTSLEIDHGSPLSLPAAAQLQTMRIIQESLTNVRKHARATQARVRITGNPQHLQVIIEDDGTGFDSANIKRGAWPQLGLETMKERAKSIGGNLEVETSQGNGTRVVLDISLPRSEDA